MTPIRGTIWAGTSPAASRNRNGSRKTMRRLRKAVRLRLFCRHRTYDGQFEPLVVVSLPHEEQPRDEEAEGQRSPNHAVEDPAHNRHFEEDTGHDPEDDPDHDPSDVEKDGLECVESNRSVPVVGFQHKKDDTADKTQQIAQGTRDVI